MCGAEYKYAGIGMREVASTDGCELRIPEKSDNGESWKLLLDHTDVVVCYAV